MSQITKIWINWTGKKTPLPLMTDDHLKNAYATCKRLTFGNEYLVNPDGQGRGVYHKQSTLTVELAKEWIEIFEEEAKRRKIKLPVIDKHTYQYDLGKKVLRKQLAIKKFKNKFEQ